MRSGVRVRSPQSTFHFRPSGQMNAYGKAIAVAALLMISVISTPPQYPLPVVVLP
jgi:hypothetical protein